MKQRGASPAQVARIAISGEHLYQIESTPEETCVIRKYRMRNLKLGKGTWLTKRISPIFPHNT